MQPARAGKVLPGRRTQVVLGGLALIVALGTVAALLVSDGEGSRSATGSSTFVITAGGTYSGTWRSTDADTAAVIVKTSEPVIIENSTVSGPGDLIIATEITNLTVRTTRAVGERPTQRGKSPGRFVATPSGFTNLVIERNNIQGTSGIWVYEYEGNRTQSETLTVRYNVVRDIDGRQTGRGNTVLLGAEQREKVQFVQLDRVFDVPYIEIAWNDIINRPGESGVEDNVNFYRSGGSEASPARIHNNYVQGGYPADPARGEYSGGGILVGDTPADSPAGNYVDIYSNIVVATSNYGISVVCGPCQRVWDNRIIASGTLPDGRRIASQNVGLSMASAAGWGGSCRDYANNLAWGNVLGWQKGTERNDSYLPDCKPVQACEGNTSVTETITLASEAAERRLWEKRVSDAGIRVGI